MPDAPNRFSMRLSHLVCALMLLGVARLAPAQAVGPQAAAADSAASATKAKAIDDPTTTGLDFNISSPSGVLISDNLTTDLLKRYLGRPGVVRLTWKTQSEEDNFGFFVYRGETKDGEYKVINDPIIIGAGNSSTENQYEYFDFNVKVGEKYFYYITDVSYSGNVREISPRLPITVKRLFLGKLVDGETTRTAITKFKDIRTTATVTPNAAEAQAGRITG